MPFVPKKAEIEAVQAAIEDEKTLEAVAKAALKASWQVFQARNLWAVAMEDGRAYAPYASEADAYKALRTGKIEGFEDDEGIQDVLKAGHIPSLGGRALVMQTTGPLVAQERIDERNEEAHGVANRLCGSCHHALAAHGLTPRSGGCYIQGCSCKAPKNPDNLVR